VSNEPGNHRATFPDTRYRNPSYWIFHPSRLLQKEEVAFIDFRGDMYFVLGCVVTLVGILGTIFRGPLGGLAARMFSASGVGLDESRRPAIERVYALGGIFMALAGLVTIVFALVTGA